MNKVSKFLDRRVVKLGGVGGSVVAASQFAASYAFAYTPSASATAVQSAFDTIEADVTNTYGPALLGLAIAGIGFLIGIKYMKGARSAS